MKNPTHIAEIDEGEATLRFIEAMLSIKRPAGVPIDVALQDFDRQFVADTRRGVRSIMDYWRECIAEMQRVS